MRSTVVRPSTWTSIGTIAGLLLGFALVAERAAAGSSPELGVADLQAVPEIPAAGSWTIQTACDYPIVRAWGAFFPANGKFYVMGGRYSDTPPSDLRNPYEYFPLGQTWAPTRPGLFADSQVNNMVGGVVDVAGVDFIVMVGGSAGGATTATSEVRAYTPIYDAMTTLVADPWPGNVGGATLPGGAAVYANKLYVFGGFTINVGMVNTIWRFDPMAAAGSRWTQMTATLPVAAGYVPTATSGNYIYGFGGSTWDGANLLDSTTSWRYYPTLDTISAVVPAIPRATAETRAVTQRDGKIWVLGGGRVAPNPSTEVNVYDPALNSWSLGPPMITARRNFAADVDPRTGEVFAGGGYNPTAPSDLNEKWSALIFNNGFETGGFCFWNNTADIYYYIENPGARFVGGDTDTGNHTDDGSTVIALPFPYQLYDTVFNSVAVGSNGHLTFGSVNNSANPSCIPVAGAGYVIAPYWTDQCTSACFNATCPFCGIFTSTSGTAPNRIFNIEYRTRYYNSGGEGVPLNYEVRLFEGQMGYEVIYAYINFFTPPSSRNLSVGVQLDNAAGNYTLYGCDTTGGTAPPLPPDGQSLLFGACGTP